MPIRDRLRKLNGSSPSPTSTETYLSYKGVILTHMDVACLKDDWLTDAGIDFWEVFLENEVLSKFPQAHIMLLRPSLTMFLMHSVGAEVRKNLPDFNNVTHVFLPINDKRNQNTEGGSHWSLLLVSLIDKVAFHYDSMDGSNSGDARKATMRLSTIIGTPLAFHDLTDCPQQDNGKDCGVFVCIIMRHLLVKRLLAVNAAEKISMSMAHKAIDSHGARKEMIKIIDNLRKEDERRGQAPSSTPPNFRRG